MFSMKSVTEKSVQLCFCIERIDEKIDGFYGVTPYVVVALGRALGVVRDQPSIEGRLERSAGLINVLHSTLTKNSSNTVR